MNKFKATFSDGTTARRTSKNRTYSHAWRVSFTQFGKPGCTVGWSSSRELAQKAMDSALSRYRKFSLACPTDSHVMSNFTSEMVTAVWA